MNRALMRLSATSLNFSSEAQKRARTHKTLEKTRETSKKTWKTTKIDGKTSKKVQKWPPSRGIQAVGVVVGPLRGASHALRYPLHLTANALAVLCPLLGS